MLLYGGYVGGTVFQKPMAYDRWKDTGTTATEAIFQPGRVASIEEVIKLLYASWARGVHGHGLLLLSALMQQPQATTRSCLQILHILVLKDVLTPSLLPIFPMSFLAPTIGSSRCQYQAWVDLYGI